MSDDTLEEWVKINEFTGRVEIGLLRQGEENSHEEKWQLSEESEPAPSGEATTKEGKAKKGGGKRESSQGGGGENEGISPKDPKKAKTVKNRDEATWKNCYDLKCDLDKHFGAGFGLQRQAEDPQGQAGWLKGLPEYAELLKFLGEWTEICRANPFWSDLGHVNNMQELRRLHAESALKSEWLLRTSKVEGLMAQVIAVSNTMRRMLSARVPAK